MSPPLEVGPTVEAASWGKRVGGGSPRSDGGDTATTPKWTADDFRMDGILGAGRFRPRLQRPVQPQAPPRGAQVLGQTQSQSTGRGAAATRNQHSEPVSIKLAGNDSAGATNRRCTLLTHSCFCDFSFYYHSLQHPHILPLLGYLETDTQVQLVLEHAAEGDLQNYLKYHCRGNANRVDLTRRVILPSLCQALQYLDECQVAHRDLKPENILVCSNKNSNSSNSCNNNEGAGVTIKLADFGCAVWWRPGGLRHSTLCGTAEFVPPK